MVDYERWSLTEVSINVNWNLVKYPVINDALAVLGGFVITVFIKN